MAIREEQRRALAEEIGLDALIPAASVASLLSCSPRHVRRLVAAGELDGVQLGTRRGLRIRAASLRAFVERHSTSAKMAVVAHAGGVDSLASRARRTTSPSGAEVVSDPHARPNRREVR